MDTDTLSISEPEEITDSGLTFTMGPMDQSDLPENSHADHLARRGELEFSVKQLCFYSDLATPNGVYLGNVDFLLDFYDAQAFVIFVIFVRFLESFS